MNNNEIRYIEINGEKIPVSQEIYSEYMRPEWREAKYTAINKRSEILIDEENEKISVRKLRHLSYEKLLEDGVEFKDESTPFEITYENKEIIKEALKILTKKEYELIVHLFYIGQTQTQYAGIMGISQAAVSSMYKNAIRKLRKYFKETKIF